MAEREHENALRAVHFGRYSVQGKDGPVERQVRPRREPRRFACTLIKYLPEIWTLYCPGFAAFRSCPADRATASRFALIPSQPVTRATKKVFAKPRFLDAAHAGAFKFLQGRRI